MNSADRQKLVLITGAAQRIGSMVARHLAGNGWDVAIHFNRSGNEASLLAQDLSLSFPGGRFGIFKADLNDPVETEKLIFLVIEKMGKPDMLINNASLFEPSSISHTPTALFDKMMTVNFRAPFILTRDFARLCGKGVVINITDTRITTSKHEHAAYTLAKKGLWELTKMAAAEFGPAIRVNAIAPGLTLPPEGKNDRYLELLAERIPMKRPGGVQPVLKSIDYITGNDYLTGQLLFCDGGENLG